MSVFWKAGKNKVNTPKEIVNVIAWANKQLDGAYGPVESNEEALRVLVNEGYCDDTYGSVTEYPFVCLSLVGNWILREDEYGNRQAVEYPDVEQARLGFDYRVNMYDQELDVD